MVNTAGSSDGVTSSGDDVGSSMWLALYQWTVYAPARHLPLPAAGCSILMQDSKVGRLHYAGRFLGQLLQSPHQSDWQVVILIQQKGVQVGWSAGCVIRGELLKSHQCSFTILERGGGIVKWIWPSDHLLLIGWVQPTDDDILVHLPHRLITRAPSCCHVCNQRNTLDEYWQVSFHACSTTYVVLMNPLSKNISCPIIKCKTLVLMQ